MISVEMYYNTSSDSDNDEEGRERNIAKAQLIVQIGQ